MREQRIFFYLKNFYDVKQARENTEANYIL